jgi:hypothetical protein
MRVHTSLRRLAGLAVAGLAVIAPAPALAHSGGARSSPRRTRAPTPSGLRSTADGTLTPGASIPPAAPERVLPAGSGALALDRGWLLRATSRPSACVARISCS